MTSPQFHQESRHTDNNYGHQYQHHPKYIPSNYRPQGSSALNGVRDNSDQHDSEQKDQTHGPQMVGQSPFQHKSSHHDHQMGANELESSPEVRSHYLQANEGRTSAEPHTASRHTSQQYLDAHQSSIAMRATPIDQSSIIKNQDESAFNNNLYIFPNGTTNQQPRPSYAQQPPSATFPQVTQFQRDPSDQDQN